MDVSVSVALITYNHEKYIKKALDSILMQQTDFNFEIVIGEDCSTDNTKDILIEYEKKYHEKFKILYRKENIGGTNNAFDVFMNCKGKYIAQLEGDDYWIDPLKLQKQFDFLENHKEEYIGIGHSVTVIDEDGKYNERETLIQGDFSKGFQKKDYYELEDFINWKLPGQSNTLVYKNIFLIKEKIDEYKKLYLAHPLIGDRTLALILSMHGKIAYENEYMSAYRYVAKKTGENYTSKSKTSKNLIDEYKYRISLQKYLNMHGEKNVVFKNRANLIFSLMRNKVKGDRSINFNAFKELYLIEPNKYIIIRNLVKISLNSILRKVKTK